MVKEYDPGGHSHAETLAAEQKALLPGLNTEYKAAALADSEISRLVVIMGKDGFKPGSTAYYTFQYVHIGLGEMGFTANGQVFNFIFSDIQPKLVTVHGRNLLRIYDQIGLRKIPWIRQTDRDFRAVGGMDTEPIITLIEVRDWKRKKERAVELAEAMDAHQE